MKLQLSLGLSPNPCSPRVEVRGSPPNPELRKIIEDSINGLQSGLAAGAHVIAITGSVPVDKLSIAHRIVTHLDEITNDVLEELLQEDI